MSSSALPHVVIPAADLLEPTGKGFDLSAKSAPTGLPPRLHIG